MCYFAILKQAPLSACTIDQNGSTTKLVANNSSFEASPCSYITELWNIEINSFA